MTKDTEYLKSAFMGYAANLGEPKFGDEEAISAGRAAGLALEMGNFQMAQLMWRNYVPAVAGMPSLAQFRAAYETHSQLFKAFDTGEEKDGAAFTAPGTRFSNAAGSYARGLYYAARTTKAAGDNSLEFWASRWGSQALMSAGFFKEATRLSEAILKGQPLEMVQAKSPGMQ
jgi:hypothetical protein